MREFVLKNTEGEEVTVLSYGGIIQSIMVRDARGDLVDVVLGFDNIQEYEYNPAYFGCIVGRYANRISDAQFSLNEHQYKLAPNNGPHSLHGGRCGFDQKEWRVTSQNLHHVTLEHTSENGDEGYPGNLQSTITYRWGDDGRLQIEYTATTDAPTPINLTNHSYFNLTGFDDCLGHFLKIDADHFTPVDHDLIPTGEIALVEHTPFDFTKGKQVGTDLRLPHSQLSFAGGFDHNWVLHHRSGELMTCAYVWSPETEILLTVSTTEPGIQFYSGNFLDGSLLGKGGQRYGKHAGLCLETQHFPDSPNRPEFPSTILNPGEVYRSKTVYAFSVLASSDFASVFDCAQ